MVRSTIRNLQSSSAHTWFLSPFYTFQYSCCIFFYLHVCLCLSVYIISFCNNIFNEFIFHSQYIFLLIFMSMCVCIIFICISNINFKFHNNKLNESIKTHTCWRNYYFIIIFNGFIGLFYNMKYFVFVDFFLIKITNNNNDDDGVATTAADGDELWWISMIIVNRIV